VEENTVAASECFVRPLGGRDVADAVVEYLRRSNGLVSLEVSTQSGGSYSGSIDLISTADPAGELARLVAHSRIWRRSITVHARFGNDPMGEAWVTTSRIRTKVRLESQDQATALYERQALVRVVALPRRLARIATIVGSVLIATITIVAFLR